MRRGHPHLYIGFGERHATTIGLTDRKLTANEELFAAMRADDDRLAAVQANAEVSADWLQPLAEAGDPDAILFLGAIERIAARRTAAQPSQQAKC